MTAALYNQSGGNFANQVDGFVYPQFIGYALRAPTSQDIYNPGTRWQNNAVNPPVIYETSGAGVWNLSTSGGAGNFTSLTVSGNLNLTGAASKLSINAGTPASASIGTTAAMTAGAVTITSSAITASSKIIYSRRTLGTAMGNVSITAQAGGSATLTSDENTETSTFDYLIIN